MPDESVLYDGALVMIDALGTKGIWKNHGSGNVLAKLRALREETERYLSQSVFPAGLEPVLKDPHNATRGFKCMFLSDTIVVGVQAKPEHTASGGNTVREVEHYADWSMKVACGIASRVMRAAIVNDPVLAYRGCATYGAFAFEDQFVVGPAVDESASWMEQAEGAFVWLTPKAVSRIDISTRNDSTLLHGGLIRYRVPLKGGGDFNTYVVLPFTNSEPTTAAERSAARARLLASFSDDDVRVQIKKQNTEKFLAFACDAIGD